MDAHRFSLQRMRLRAFDLSERTARAGRDSLAGRLDRWRSRGFMIIQCAVTGALAWLLARVLLGHPMPSFAPVAALITLGVTFGQRLRRAVEVAVGVAVGVFVGDAFVSLFGTGPWQIAVVCLIAMSLATLLGAGQLMIMQAGVQSIIVIALVPNPGQGLNRWLDALVGCALALLVATVAPTGPLRRPRILAAQFLQEMAATITDASAALRADDADAADLVLERARAGEDSLATLSEASSEGLAVVRHSPFLRGRLPTVQALADRFEPLDRASRNLRVLARRSAIALWRGESVPLSYLVVLDQLAEVVTFMANELYDRRLPTAAQDRLIAVGRQTAQLRLQDSISAVVIVAQVRSILVDLLELTGMDYVEARDSVPDML